MAEETQEKQETKEKKNKKINKMSLTEIRAALEKTKEKMGGLDSKYAYELQKQLKKLEAKEA